jgi:pentatricopeptide repeat protein
MLLPRRVIQIHSNQSKSVQRHQSLTWKPKLVFGSRIGFCTTTNSTIESPSNNFQLLRNAIKTSEPSAAIRYFEKLKQENKLSNIEPSLFSSFIELLKSQKRVGFLKGVYHSMSDKMKENSAICQQMLTGFAFCRDIPNMLELMHFMLEHQLEDAQSYLTVMNCFAERSDTQKVEEWNEKLHKAYPNAPRWIREGSITSLIKAHSLSGNHEKAVEWFNKFETLNIRPSVHSYKAIIRGYLRQHITDEALVWKQKMEKQFEPDLHTGVLFFRTFVEMKKKKEFEELFQQLTKDHEMENAAAILYTSAIEACSKIRDFEGLIHWYQALNSDKSVLISNEILQKIMSAVARVDREIIIQLFQAWEENKVQNNEQVYDLIIQAYVFVDDLPSTLFWVEQMHQRNVACDLNTYEKIFKLLFMQNDFENMAKIFEALKVIGVSPNKTLYDYMLKLCLRNQNTKLQRKLINEMHERKILNYL